MSCAVDDDKLHRAIQQYVIADILNRKGGANSSQRSSHGAVEWSTVVCEREGDRDGDRDR